MNLPLVIAALWTVAALPQTQAAESAPRKPRVEPQIVSMTPLSVARGTRPTLEIRGKGLASAHAVLFDCSTLKGEIKALDDKSDEQRLTWELSIPQDTTLGVHTLRIVSPMGVTGPRSLLVHNEISVSEEDLPPELENPGRRLPGAPVVVLGKISAIGEQDYYAFNAEAGQEFLFEVYNDRRFDAQIFIYEQAESWFDNRTLKRIAFNDEPNRAYGETAPVLSHRFEKKGQYLVAVGAFLGGGGSDHFYALRVAPARERPVPWNDRLAAHPKTGDWEERKFIRELGQDRLSDLRARNIAEKAESELPRLALVSAVESVEQAATILEITLPAQIEGAFDEPGDIDRFRFNIKDATGLAIEIETPARPAPYCTPRVAIIDSGGQEVLHNIFAWVEGSGEFIGKAIEPKVIAQFIQGGEYLLEIKEVTIRNGGPDYRYKVIIREQIPHVGKVNVASSFGRGGNGMLTKGASIDHLNLAPGELRKISVMSELEEGFAGQVVLHLENLPPGMEVLPVAEVEADRPRILDEGKKERFRPNYGPLNLLLTVSSNAAATRLPYLVRIQAKPIVNGKAGPLLPVQTVPVMIVRPDEPLPPAAPQIAQLRE